MAVSIAKLAIQFVADTSGMVAGTKKAESALGGFVGKAKSIGGQLAGAFGFVGAGAAVLGFVGSVRKSFKELDDLAKMSTKLGIPVEQLQMLDHAASLSGVSTEQAANGIAKMNDIIGEAIGGNKAAIATFDALGLKAEDLAAKSPTEALIDIADAMNQLPNQATKTKIGMDIFSRSAKDLLPLLAEGREGIEKLFAERREMGLFDREQLARVEAANDAWDSMLTSLKMISGEIAVSLSPAMEAFANQVRELQPEMQKLFQGITDPASGNALQQAAGQLGEAAATGDLKTLSKKALAGQLNMLTFGQGHEGIKGFAEATAKWLTGERSAMTPEQLAQIGKEQMEQWAIDDANAPTEATLRGLDNIATANALAEQAKPDIFAAGPEADKLFGRLKKPVLDTVGDLFSTIDRKANAALGGITGNVGDSALGNLLDSAEMGLQSFADASGMAQANIDALSASPVIGQAAALQGGTAAAFSQARQNFADQQKAEEAKVQKSQLDMLAKIEKNTGINTKELQQATF